MRAVVQRVSKGSVIVNNEVIDSIGPGMVVLLGIGSDDNQEDLNYMVDKICHLRIFPDDEGKMNNSIKDSGGSVLVVSQFTLYGDCRKGRRPSFSNAALPEKAKALYEDFIDLLNKNGITTGEGQFQAMMEVQIFNDGPVTMLIDSKRHF